MSAATENDAGWRIADGFDEEQRERWQRKLVLPVATDLDAAQQLLNSGTGDSFAALVEQSDNPVARLVAIHLFNALIANGVSFADARDVNLSAWGSTEQFFSRQVFFSLVPLTSVYCPREIHEMFATAYDAWHDNRLKAVCNVHVRDALSALVEELSAT